MAVYTVTGIRVPVTVTAEATPPCYLSQPFPQESICLTSTVEPLNSRSHETQTIPYYLLFAAVTLSAVAQNVGEAFYVYRNDGKVNVFMRNQIEKMEYSNEDENGNAYDEIVTQLVFTPDSVYYIPIASIDSVGFVTPENKYRPEVRQIEGELRSYVISQDEHTILFSSGIPVNIMPKIGDKLVTLEMSDVFPIGFAGEVTSVTTKSNGVEVVCAPVALEDVGESLLWRF